MLLEARGPSQQGAGPCQVWLGTTGASRLHFQSDPLPSAPQPQPSLRGHGGSLTSWPLKWTSSKEPLLLFSYAPLAPRLTVRSCCPACCPQLGHQCLLVQGAGPQRFPHFSQLQQTQNPEARGRLAPGSARGSRSAEGGPPHLHTHQPPGSPWPQTCSSQKRQPADIFKTGLVVWGGSAVRVTFGDI